LLSKNEGNVRSDHWRNGNRVVEFFSRLGKFQHTICKKLDPFTVEGIPCQVYRTKFGNVSFMVNGHIHMLPTIEIDQVGLQDQRFSIEGTVITDNAKLDDANAVFSTRHSNCEQRIHLSNRFLSEET